MSVIRRQHTRSFTVIGNDACNNESLSYEALGLLAYLLSRPDNWKVHTRQLAGRGSVGRDKIRRVLGELIDAGYVTRTDQLRDATGRRYAGVEYVVTDEPAVRKGESAADAAASPNSQETGFQGPENPPLLKNNREQIPLSPPTAILAAGAARAFEEVTFPAALSRWRAGLIDFPKAKPIAVPAARRVFHGLEVSDRAPAIRFMPAYFAAQRLVGRQYPHSLATYLRGKAWRYHGSEIAEISSPTLPSAPPLPGAAGTEPGAARPNGLSNHGSWPT